MIDLYSLEPTGNTGGRVYLRMTHQALSGLARLYLLPDPKRTDPVRRWRKLRHLATLAPDIDQIDDPDAWYLWDDISLLLFTPAMRRHTIFIFHHHEPRQYDSPNIDPILSKAMLAALRECATVVCVAPYWQRYLADQDVYATVIHNGFDLAEIEAACQEPRGKLKAEFGLPADTIAVYAGKAARWKGVDLVAEAVNGEPDITVISTGTRATRTGDHHLTLPRIDYLRLIRACDVGVFASQMAEGWSRCAAEAILLGLPCLLSHCAGLGDLARLTGQPAPDLFCLPEQIHALASADTTDTIRQAQQQLRRYDTAWFTDHWRTLFATLAGDSETVEPDGANR